MYIQIQTEGGLFCVFFSLSEQYSMSVFRVFTFASVTARPFLHVSPLFHTFPTPQNLRPSSLSHICFLRLSCISIAAFFATARVLSLFFLFRVCVCLCVCVRGAEMNVKCFSGRLCSHPERCLDWSFSQPLCVWVTVFCHSIDYAVSLTLTHTYITTHW